VERPSFGVTCPNDIKLYADRAKNYTTVTWDSVNATDNSGVAPNVVKYGVPFANRFYQGRHEVIYNASDEAGNYRICKFHVTIEGKLKLVQLQKKPSESSKNWQLPQSGLIISSMIS